jgi:carbohydrate kinase (thermoresistant glucokinase family)
MQKPFVLYITGVSGSGKTTLGTQVAARLDVLFADGDDFHPPENIAKMHSGQPLDDQDRVGWLAAIRDFVAKRLTENQSLVVACSALRAIYRAQLMQDVPMEQVRWVHLFGDFEVIKSRMEARKGHFMPPGLLRSQFDLWEKPESGLLLDVQEDITELAGKCVTYCQGT